MLDIILQIVTIIITILLGERLFVIILEPVLMKSLLIQKLRKLIKAHRYGSTIEMFAMMIFFGGVFGGLELPPLLNGFIMGLILNFNYALINGNDELANQNNNKE